MLKPTLTLTPDRPVPESSNPTLDSCSPRGHIRRRLSRSTTIIAQVDRHLDRAVPRTERHGALPRQASRRRACVRKCASPHYCIPQIPSRRSVVPLPQEYSKAERLDLARRSRTEPPAFGGSERRRLTRELHERLLARQAVGHRQSQGQGEGQGQHQLRRCQAVLLVSQRIFDTRSESVIAPIIAHQPAWWLHRTSLFQQSPQQPQPSQCSPRRRPGSVLRRRQRQWCPQPRSHLSGSAPATRAH